MKYHIQYSETAKQFAIFNGDILFIQMDSLEDILIYLRKNLCYDPAVIKILVVDTFKVGS